MTDTPASPDPGQNRNKNLGIFLALGMLAMLGASFAAVPLYKIFCQETGFGGTPKIALDLPNRVEESRTLRIHFNSDHSHKLPWHFKPLQQEVRVKAGELGLAFYHVRNKLDKPIKGIAVYNVTPSKAGAYFNKVACFCFQEQLLMPHEELDMPVQFFIDPDIVKDENTRDLQTITLSYTFYPIEDFTAAEIDNLKRFEKNKQAKHQKQ